MNKYSKGSSMVISVLMFLVMPALLPTTCSALDCRKHVFAPQCRGIIAKRAGWTHRSLSRPGEYSAVEVPPSLVQLLEGDADDDVVYKTYDDLTYQETSPTKYTGELTGEEAEPMLEGAEFWVYPRAQMTRLAQQRRLRNGLPAEAWWGRHRPTRSPGEQFSKAIGRAAAVVPQK